MDLRWAALLATAGGGQRQGGANTADEQVVIPEALQEDVGQYLARHAMAVWLLARLAIQKGFMMPVTIRAPWIPANQRIWHSSGGQQHGGQGVGGGDQGA